MEAGQGDADAVNGQLRGTRMVGEASASMLGAAGERKVNQPAIHDIGAGAVEVNVKGDAAGGGELGGLELALDGGEGEVERGIGMGADDAGAVEGLARALVLLGNEDGEAGLREAAGAFAAGRAGADDKDIEFRAPSGHRCA
jgi:hypothetical protein